MPALLRRTPPRNNGSQDARAQTPVDEELRAFPELAAAIKANRASFDTYVRARFLAEESFNREPTSRAVFGKWRFDLLEAFQGESGQICGSYYCEHLIGATARTDRSRFALVFNSHTWGKEEELLTSCDGLYWEGIDYLAGTERTTFVERLYAVASDLLALLDTRCGENASNGRQVSNDTTDPALRAQALEALEAKLQSVRGFYAKAARKRARLRYLAGVVAGFGASVALAGLLLFALWLSGLVSVEDRGEMVTIWLAGAVGAVVSVMQRVSSHTLELNHEAGRFELMLLGAIRPLLGGAVAVALYTLFAGGILDFAMPDGASNETYYFAGIGFLSGFSERFAQDMLVKTNSRFPGTDRGHQRAEPRTDSPSPTTTGDHV